MTRRFHCTRCGHDEGWSPPEVADQGIGRGEVQKGAGALADVAGEVLLAHVLEQFVPAVHVKVAEVAARVLCCHVRRQVISAVRLQLQREAPLRLPGRLLLLLSLLQSMFLYLILLSNACRSAVHIQSQRKAVRAQLRIAVRVRELSMHAWMRAKQVTLMRRRHSFRSSMDHRRQQTQPGHQQDT